MEDTPSDELDQEFLFSEKTVLVFSASKNILEGKLEKDVEDRNGDKGLFIMTLVWVALTSLIGQTLGEDYRLRLLPQIALFSHMSSIFFWSGISCLIPLALYNSFQSREEFGLATLCIRIKERKFWITSGTTTPFELPFENVRSVLIRKDALDNAKHKMTVTDVKGNSYTINRLSEIKNLDDFADFCRRINVKYEYRKDLYKNPMLKNLLIGVGAFLLFCSISVDGISIESLVMVCMLLACFPLLRLYRKWKQQS